ILTRLAQRSRLIFVPDTSASVFFLVFVLFELFTGLVEFVFIGRVRIKIDLSLVFVLSCVDVLVFECFFVARGRRSFGRGSCLLSRSFANSLFRCCFLGGLFSRLLCCLFGRFLRRLLSGFLGRFLRGLFGRGLYCRSLLCALAESLV